MATELSFASSAHDRISHVLDIFQSISLATPEKVRRPSAAQAEHCLEATLEATPQSVRVPFESSDDGLPQHIPLAEFGSPLRCDFCVRASPGPSFLNVNSVYKIGLFESKPPAASRSTVEANAYPLAPRAYPDHHQSQYSQKGQKGQKGQNMPLSLRGSNPTGIRNYGQRRIRKRISRHFASEGYPTLFSMSSSTLPIEKVI